MSTGAIASAGERASVQGEADELFNGMEGPAEGRDLSVEPVSPRALIRSLKRISGHLMAERFDQIPSALERVRSELDKFCMQRGSNSENVFRFIDSLLATEDWTKLAQLQVGKIVAVSKMLDQLS